MISYPIVGKHIKEARVRAGLSQAEAADRAGISASYFGKYERGDIKPNLDRLGDICTAVGLPLEGAFQGALITEGKVLDNMPPTAEEFELYMKAIAKKADDRTKCIMMRLCDELANLQIDNLQDHQD